MRVFRGERVTNSRVCAEKFIDDAGGECWRRDVKRSLSVSARFNYIFHRFCISISV